eukprot:TRINITY_DN37332_c0_g1_i1.p1 TRINITY_DN37332_c0_g1~~TRINITY_DN37332_c0_g1_i1.p1  ORF type:complete len:400 (-),score=43.01 TRINITY_DN37332_c0_g1_i1:180-1379(-)
MGASSIFLHSTCPSSPLSPLKTSSYTLNKHNLSLKPFDGGKISLRHFIKHLRYGPPTNPTSTKMTITYRCPPLKCSYSDSSPPSPQTPQTKFLKIPFFSSPEIPFSSFFNLSTLTPLDVCKWAGIISLALAATKRTTRLLLNPFFWMYFSWTWLFWPWVVAIALAFYGLYCLRKHSQQKAGIPEQVVIVTSAITWLTLVPPAHFNGYLEGWPIVFFFAYHYFFFFESSVRSRLYGDLYPRPHDPRWDISLPFPARLAFAGAILVGHWLAALEGPELHLVPGGWANLAIWALIITGQFMKYHSTLYLHKYSEKVLVPTSVVQFGPYRWVRHPIYVSVMLLFATYCVALRAPFSLLFIVGACVVYYNQKAQLEEALLEETFGEAYSAYRSKVPYKFIPGVF